MENILNWLLQQAPVVVLACFACYALWKRLANKDEDFQKERELHKVEIKELNEAHRLEMKEKNEYILQSEIKNIKTLEGVIKLLDDVEKSNTVIKETVNELKDLVKELKSN
jgi:ABC-type nickel/cobalt efflux system permease component RcnA